MSDQKETTQQSSIVRDENLNMDKLLKASGRTPQQAQDLQGHGSIVETEDGGAGIVIDPNHEKRKLLDASKNEKLESLVDGSVPIYERVSGTVASNTVDYGTAIVKKDPTSEDARSIMGVKEAFAGFVPTMSGLAPTGSQEGEEFQQAMKDLSSGKFVLPTVEQYEKQKAELARKRKMEEEQRMETQNNHVETPSVPQNTQTQPPVQQEQPKVINLAEMEQKQQEYSTRNEHPQNQPIEQAPVSAQGQVPQQVAKFVIPEGQARDFVESLPADQQEKVEASKIIQVEEVRTVKVPVATRTITSLDQYKRIASKKVTTEAVEVPLMNSGYVAVVKGCGSLEMASILPDPTTMEWEDYAKLYQFCFNNLISTSIGTMSFRDFQVKTSPYDLTAMVHAILRASQPDEQSITLTCGGDNCGKDYDITYYLSELVDWESVSEESVNRVKELLDVKDVIEDAKKLQESSPVMTRRYIDIGDGKTVCIKSPNGPMIIERADESLINQVSTKTSPIVSIFLLQVEKISLEMPDENGDLQVYDLLDPLVIAEEIQTWSDTQLEIIKKELSELKMYPQYTYSFKGKDGKPIKCPHCGLEEKKVACEVEQLVFQRVYRATT